MVGGLPRPAGLAVPKLLPILAYPAFAVRCNFVPHTAVAGAKTMRPEFHGAAAGKIKYYDLRPCNRGFGGYRAALGTDDPRYRSAD